MSKPDYSREFVISLMSVQHVLYTALRLMRNVCLLAERKSSSAGRRHFIGLILKGIEGWEPTDYEWKHGFGKRGLLNQASVRSALGDDFLLRLVSESDWVGVDPAGFTEPLGVSNPDVLRAKVERAFRKRSERVDSIGWVRQPEPDEVSLAARPAVRPDPQTAIDAGHLRLLDKLFPALSYKEGYWPENTRS